MVIKYWINTLCLHRILVYMGTDLILITMKFRDILESIESEALTCTQSTHHQTLEYYGCSGIHQVQFGFLEGLRKIILVKNCFKLHLQCTGSFQIASCTSGKPGISTLQIKTFPSSIILGMILIELIVVLPFKIV